MPLGEGLADDVTALACLARRLNRIQLARLIHQAAMQASGEGAWHGPDAHADQGLVLALRRTASRIEGAWNAGEARRQAWNTSLARYHPRYHEGFLYPLTEEPHDA